MAAEGKGGGEQVDRQAWRRSNWIQATCALGFIGLVIAFDWVINHRLTYVAPVVIGVAVGLTALAVRFARRRHVGRR